MRVKSVCLAVAAMVAFLPAVSLAQVPDDVVSATMIPGWRMENGNHMTALRLQLAPGWKTYWRAPGDAGIPPHFDWSGSRNLGAVQTHWPVPEVYYLNGLRSVGYADQVIIPLELTPESTGGLIELAGRIEIGVCEDICVPVSFRISADLGDSPLRPHPEISAILANRPMTSAEAGVVAARCTFEPISDGIRLTASIEMPQIGQSEETVVEFADRSVWVSAPQAERAGGTLTIVSELVPSHGAPFFLDRSGLRFTVLAESAAVDIRGCAAG